MARKFLNLGGIKFPIEAATKSDAFLGKRGSGKTYNAAVYAEELHTAGIPILVFDPIDVWWGLKLNKDGKSKGLDIPVFGLEHCDIPLTRDMGPEIVEAIVENNASAIISTFGMPKKQQRHLITELAEALLIKNNTPRHVFIEEAHEFVPQRVMGEMGRVFNAVSNLVVMGRNRGLGVTLINQRAATINKDVLTQIDTLVALRNVAPQDRKALREWVEHYSVEEKFDKFMASLPGLKTGDAWIWSPEFLNVFKKVRIRERKTFHPDREILGKKFTMPDMKKLDVSGFVERFKSKIEAKREEKRSDKDKIADLVAENRRLKHGKPAVTQDQIDAAVAPIQSDFENQMAEINKRVQKSFKTIAETVMPKIISLSDAINDFYNLTKPMIEDLEKLKDLGIDIPEFELQTPAQRKIVRNIVERHIPKRSQGTRKDNRATGSLRGAPLKMLEVLVQRAPLKFTRSQLALASGYSLKSSTITVAISKLFQAGYIEKHGKELWPTQEGLNYFGIDIPVPQTVDERLSMWSSKLGNSFPGKLYNLLIENRGHWFSRDEAAEALDYSPDSSTITVGISRLYQNGLLEKDGSNIRAAEELFIK